MHLGGILLINYKCFETGSFMFFIVFISISLTYPSNKGFDIITFIFRTLHNDTNIFLLFYFINSFLYPS